ncbi:MULTISPECIES: condensation domain-containing protein [unclassified Clostridium]|uniref:condensation domain-containing protein n=1 Tax=unclassified Clostridium TaxID=2614128 RepID=UPI0002981541|nr:MULTISPECIES: condensation domain-containing protein [unclassified Clostridium]EKQ56856.1 MAG: hypothetical protein A370_01632 [Clostridium sp. Maddingley MBC34-26]
MTKSKKFKAEAFDIMQYFYGSVHEPLIHCLIDFSCHIDKAALIKAVTLSLKTNPLISCCFNIAARRPYWEEKNFTGEDIVRVVIADSNEEEQKTKLLASTIDITKEPQLKIYLFQKQDTDTLCIIINHMLCDGAGFKEYLYTLSNLYNECKSGNKNLLNAKSLPRNSYQILNNFKFTEKLNVFFSKYNLSKQENELKYSLQGDKNNPLFVALDITKDEFAHIKAYAKNKDVTVNDLIITAYMKVLHKRTGEERIIIPCPVDLRKYLYPNQEHGICNLTSNFICDVIIMKNDSFEDILIQVSKQIKEQKSNDNCLKPVIILELVFNLLPFAILHKVFNKFFTIPVTSFTNLGVIDKKQLRFNDAEITHTYITGAVKYVPYFQIAVSTYDNTCTLSCNLYGTPEDKICIEQFLMDMKNELLCHK